MSALFTNIYTPDVLNCIANLSNDEVFTPPEIANKMLDLLPQELFENPDTKFLDKAVMGLIQEIPQIGAISRLFANDRPMRSYFFALSPVR